MQASRDQTLAWFGSMSHWLMKRSSYCQIIERFSTSQITWDAFKAVTRGVNISSIKGTRTQHNHTNTLLLDKEKECAQAHGNSPSSKSLPDLQFARRELYLHYQELAHIIFSKRDKNEWLLALLVVDTQPLMVIPCIYSPSGTLLTSPDRILRSFVSFYIDLYSPIFIFNSVYSSFHNIE